VNVLLHLLHKLLLKNVLPHTGAIIAGAVGATVAGSAAGACDFNIVKRVAPFTQTFRIFHAHYDLGLSIAYLIAPGGASYKILNGRLIADDTPVRVIVLCGSVATRLDFEKWDRALASSP